MQHCWLEVDQVDHLRGNAGSLSCCQLIASKEIEISALKLRGSEFIEKLK